MATQPGLQISLLTDQLGDPPREVGVVVTNLHDPGQQGLPGPSIINLPGLNTGGQVVSNGVTFNPPTLDQQGCPALHVGEDWFDKIHIFPKRIDYGNIVTTTDTEVEIYNAYRGAIRQLISIDNPVASGLFFIVLPSFPADIGAQDGIVLDLRATTNGVPAFDDVLTFETDVSSPELAVTGTRIILLPFRPEAPLTERLGFLTDVMVKLDAGEQRVALRQAPRQTFQLTYKREEEVEFRRFTNLLIQWQGRTFGLPVWYEPTTLSAEAVATDTVLNVGSTDYSDYRVGGLVGLITDDNTFEVLQVSAITSTTITLNSGLIGTFPVNTEVYPIRACVIEKEVRGLRYPVNLDELTVKFLCVENDVDIADASAWNTFNSKVLLDGPNLISGTHQMKFLLDSEVIDGKTGAIAIDGVWPYGRQGRMQGFLCNSRQSLWELRQLLHSLRGKQTSFYSPTFRKDFTVVTGLLSSSADMDITNVGFTTYVQEREPYHRIRLIKTDGTVIDRTIISSVVVDEDTETLVVDSNWPSDIAVDEIERVEFNELVRFDTDNFVFEHQNARGDVRVIVPIINVKDEA